MIADIITFDCYGTLIDWESGIVGAFRSEAARDGINLNPKDIVDAYMAEEQDVEAGAYRTYREVLTETAERVAKRLGWALNAERASFLPESLAGWAPFPDTNSALEKLAEKYKLGILSNIDDDLLAGTRRHFTVDFDLIVTAQQVRSYKPGFAHFQEARKRMGDSKHLHAACSYFHDVVPASTLGIPSAWVNRRNDSIAGGGVHPTYTVHDLSGLVSLLDGIEAS